MEIAFATGNNNKIMEIQLALGEAGIRIIQKDIDLEEPRSDSLEDIAVSKAVQAREKLGMPVIAEDSGLFINSLNGFPGTNSRWVFDKIGDEGILRLMEGVDERSAVFRSCVVFASPGRTPVAFKGEKQGSISKKAIGHGGFGFDPVFVPEESKTTWADNPGLKSQSSHRKEAIEKFAAWAKDNIS